MNAKIIFPGTMQTALRSTLLRDSPRESAAILFCGYSKRPEATHLLVRDVMHLSGDDFAKQTEFAVTIDPRAVAKALQFARQNDYSIALTHTHPFSSQPQFSEVDDAGEAMVMPTLFRRAPMRPHGAVVLGESGIAGRVYTSNGAAPNSVTIWNAGAFLTQSTQIRRDDAKEIHHRSILALGAQGHALVERLRVGIVGLGGTGSATAQQLAYLGVNNYVLMDFDRIEATNLNRLIGATISDVARPKARVLRERIKAIVPEATVEAVVGSALYKETGDLLLDCDIIFCCTDTHASRALLNQIAYQYYIPVIDMGIRIDTEHDRITTMSGRVQLLSPGLACLICQSTLDPETIRRELLSDQERSADEYIVGNDVPQPSVISLNSTVSSLAVTMFLSVVTGFPVKARHQLYKIADGSVRAIHSAPLRECIVCSKHGALGRGDSWQLPWRLTP